ncbi:NAC transcription factor 29 [Camellia lanceoleosa]|uniref:NAC transcription factor 29 n=1 Tax=Camellia lanceoleosa TaxID=1840588 RepID=A0ACC0GYN9_9ERIC|nr:NAC transcription factor 29 [Camellia lanceoleosa]
MEDQQYQPIEEQQAQASVSTLANNVDHVDVDEYFASLPPGYRFNPTDAVLIVNYLKRKINHQTLPINKIHDVHLYKFNPQYLSENYKPYEEKEWYFFTPRDRKYKNGKRPNRAAGDGYWKVTGTNKTVRFMGADVGFRTALVFYKGIPPKGEKTNWIMHEYRLPNNHPKAPTVGNEMRADDCVLCKIYKNVDRSRSIRNRYPDDEEVVPAEHYYNEHLPAENSAMLPSLESLIPGEAMEMDSGYNGKVNPNAFINSHFLQTPQLHFNHDQVMMTNSTYFNYPYDVNKPPIQLAMQLTLKQPQSIDGMKSNMRPKSMNQNLHCWALEPRGLDEELKGPMFQSDAHIDEWFPGLENSVPSCCRMPSHTGDIK